ncbi:MAG: nicotinamide-nucleotide amidohydrolase family protein [Clostridia bacterium]|nr:nicotinamide-nucleotide amidohydrolase family protein [Clostridia bacterium]
MHPSLTLVILTSRHAGGLAEGESVLKTLSRRGYAPDCVSKVAYDDGTLVGRCLENALDFFDVTILCCPKSMTYSAENFAGQKNFQKTSDFGFKTAEKRLYIKCTDDQSAPSADEICSAMDYDLGRQDTVSYLKCAALPDGILQSSVEEAKQACPDARLNIAGLHGDCRIEIVRPASVQDSAYEEMYRTLLQRLGDYVYAMEDVELNERVVQLLKLRKMYISVAESFTGGGVCRKLVEIPGVSAVFDEGLNTYSNRAKMARLGVDRATLNTYGAVSSQTAAEMCLGLLKTGACDVAVSTTGIAGPDSDGTSKPVGLMYIGCGTQDRIDVFEYRLSGSREDITATGINLALYHVYKTIKQSGQSF